MKRMNGRVQGMAGMLIVTAGIVTAAIVASHAEDADSPATAREKDFDAITASIKSFQDAFNRHDAKSLVAHFSDSGEYVNDAGIVFQGPSVIEKEFAAQFKVIPNSKIQLDVVDLRFVGNGLAIEEGTATVLPDEDAPAIISRYIVVHTRQGESWKMVSARDLDSRPLSAHDHLMQLGWLVGNWVDESDQALGQTSFTWSENGNFLVSSFTITTRDGNEISGTQRIGWDPQKEQIRSWVFDSEGGFAEGFWTLIDGVWVVRLSGVRPDGSNGSATLHYTPVGEDRFEYRSSNRIVGDELTPPVSLTVVRRPPVPKAN
ncbi:MAG: hypothetical protein ACI8P0_003725 [Planctomycetaceae bacterium]|jgi:uncharacterized protein (TIGR02246 family)